MKLLSNIVSTDLVTGIFSGGVVTQSSPTTINISSGQGIIVDDTMEPRRYSEVTWSDKIDVPIPTILTSNRSYVLIRPNGQVEVTQITPDSAKVRDNIYLAEILHPSNEIIYISDEPIVSNDSNNLAQDLGYIFSNSIISGGRISASTNPMEIDISETIFFDPGVNFRENPKDPNFKAYGPFISPTLTYIDRNGDIIESRNTVNPNTYDVNGVMTSLQPNRVSIQRLFVSQNLLYVLYGQKQYNDLNTALSSIDQDELNVVIPPETSGFIFLGYIVSVRSATSLSDPLQARIINISSISDFSKSTPSASKLSDLIDVESPLIPSDGDYLRFNGNTNVFESTSFVHPDNAAWTVDTDSLIASRTFSLPGSINGVLQPVYINLPKDISQEIGSSFSFLNGEIISNIGMYGIETSIMVLLSMPQNRSIGMSVAIGNRNNIPTTIGDTNTETFISRFREIKRGDGSTDLGTVTITHTFKPVGRPVMDFSLSGIDANEDIVLVMWSRTSDAATVTIEDGIFSIVRIEVQ